MNLYPYQKKGVEHLLSMPFGKPHALLADAPGTGKTPMAIEAAKIAGCKNGVIVCPAIIKEQWRRQMIAWGLCAEDEIQVAYGLDYPVSAAPWLVINYDILREHKIKSQILQRGWHVLMLDEAHRLKSHASQQTHAVFHARSGIGTRAYWKWALSGSIMPNRPAELYPLLKTMAPDTLRPYDNWPAFINRFCGGAYMAGKGASNIPELTERIQPFMLRRELENVWRECPPIIDNTIWLDVPFRQHPEWSSCLMEATERRVVAEAKIPYIVAYLRDRLESGVDKIVCFTYHRSVIEGLQSALQEFNPALIYGGLSPIKREESLAKFTRNPLCRLFLLQISSAGEGIDGLQHVASEYVQAEPEWSPGREDQAERRLKRLGQTKPVIATKLIVADSYEEVIFYSNARKRRVIDVVLKPNGGNFVMSLEDNTGRIAIALEAFVPLANLLTQVLQTAQANPVQSFAPPAAPLQAPPAAPPSPLSLVPNAQPSITLTPSIPIQQAPIGAPLMPAPEAQANPLLGNAPSGLIAQPAPALVAPTPVAAPAAQTDKAFQDAVLGIFQPLGAVGMQKFQVVLGQFGIQRLGDLPANMQEAFLTTSKAAVAA